MSEVCSNIHHLFNTLKRCSFPFDQLKIPTNGIYVLFEKGETSHGGDRIVRIGTHTGENQLRSRLAQHFINENKDRSIFRKNIGRALLNKTNDSFLEQWEIDLTTRKSKEKFKAKIDMLRQKKIEKNVTECLQNNFSFIVFEVKEKDKRLAMESKLISTVSACEECQASQKWLGLFSPKIKIKESGLWLVNELHKKPLNEGDFRELQKLVGNGN